MTAAVGINEIKDVSPDAEPPFSVDEFRRTVSMEIIENSPDRFRFDLRGIQAPIANTLRRIILDEVPTMAADTIVFRDNTSILPDEVLAQRVGLLPLNVDPRLFEFHREHEPVTEKNSVVFRLDITAPATLERNPADHSGGWYCVFSGDFQWVPLGAQKEWLPLPPAITQPDILLAKLAPGQRICAEVYCHKGIGKFHAKWQPVGTAWYSMAPVIKFDPSVLVEMTIAQDLDFRVEEACRSVRVAQATKTADVPGIVELASVEGEAPELSKFQRDPPEKRALHALKRSCPAGVFDRVRSIQDLEDFSHNFPEDCAKCTVCRECLRFFIDTEKSTAGMTIGLDKTHFRFVVEPVGALTGPEVVEQAFLVLKEKAQLLKDSLQV